ncbi:MAG TPA: penicillin-binding protein 2 [Solirubrobacteraceae bacterium]
MALRQRRLGLLLAAFALLLGVAAIRTLQLTTVNSGSLASAGNLEHEALVTIPPPRGSILDRNGVLLAVTEPAWDITATPKLVADPTTFALELAPLLHEHAASIQQQLAHPTSSANYTVLARQVSDATAKEIRTLGLTGLALSSDPLRAYPQDYGYLAAQVLGGVGTEGNGLAGIEQEFNKTLTGTAGVQHVIYDGQGRPIHVGGSTAVAGKDVQLTLDAPLQHYADTVASSTGENYNALHVSVIMLQPRTGAVLAMSNWPRVNANDPSKVGLSENYGVGLDYEPGSTFKIVTMSGALTDGLISPSTQLTVPDQIQVADRVIHDSDIHPTEVLKVGQILAQSSNVGTIEIAEKLGASRLYHWIRTFGFGSPTGVGLPNDEPGEVPAVANWSGSSIGNIPIGQGVDVTPLQLADAYGAIADGGILRRPHIVESVGGVPVRLPKGKRIISATVAHQVSGMLEEVTRAGGTAAEIQIDGYTLAGKTGTANKPINGVYSTKDYWASFVGFAPAQDPQVETLVLVDQPQGAIYGTEVAAPAWQKIMDFAIPYLKVSPH